MSALPDARPKIVFVNRFFFPDHSATSQILGDLAFDLVRQGRTVDVVTSRMLYDDPGARLSPFEIVEGVRVHRVWSTSFGRANLFGRAFDYLSFYFGAAVALWRQVDARTILVAKTDPPLISLVAAPIARLRRARLINWLQDLFPEVAHALGVRMARGPALALMRSARNLSLRNATNVVLGERMQSLLRAQGVRQERIHIIHNWADGAAIRPVHHAANPLRNEWGLGASFVVGYSGNLGRAHEFETILDAAELLAARREVVFLFIGGGAQLSKVEEQVRVRQLPNVRFQPYQPRSRLSLSLGVADVHLVSLNPDLEGLIVPSKFYGIAAAGRPTLFIGDVSGEIPVILRRHACGRSVMTADAPALAAAISELALHADMCAMLGRNARDVFEEHFDRPKALTAWAQIIDSQASCDR